MRASSLAAMIFTLGAGCASERMPAAADVAGFQQATADLSTAAALYRAGTSTMQSPSECAGALQRYLDRARADVDQMGHVAGRMDDQLATLGRMMDGDIGCGMEVIDGELARHAAAACGSPDTSSNRAEAARHCDAMRSFVDHLQMRAGELARMTGSTPGMMNGGMGWAGMDGGWMMPDGGWMDWGHEMPGCSFADGGFWMMDGGMPGWDGGMPGWDGGMPGWDGGPMMDGGMH